MLEPIIEFETEPEALKCLKEWQHRLYLDSWIIQLKSEYFKDMPEIGKCGYCNFQMENKTAVITLCLRDGCDNTVMKFCQELILVHELLHCIYNWVGHNDTYESVFTSTLQHQQIELMARSLIMAKYNIGPEWFKNIDDR